MLSRPHLLATLRAYAEHYNGRRPLGRTCSAALSMSTKSSPDHVFGTKGCPDVSSSHGDANRSIIWVCDSMDSPSPPPRSIAFAAVVSAGVPSAELYALALDLQRLREVDPRLREANWSNHGPAIGALATVRTDIAFAQPWVQRMIGEQTGTVRLLELVPNKRIACLCEHDRGLAYLRVSFEGSKEHCTLHFSGWIRARQAQAHNMMRLLSPLIVLLIEHCIQRSADRACGYLRRQSTALVTSP